MKSLKKRIISTVLFVVLILTVSGIAPYSYIDYSLNLNAIDVSDAAMKAIEDQISKITQSIKENQTKLDNREQDLLNELQTKKLLDRDLELTQDLLQKQKELIIELNNLIRIQKDNMTDLEGDIVEKYDMFLQIMKSAYEEGNVNILEVILTSGSIPEFFMNVEYAASLLNYQQQVMQELNVKAEELRLAKIDLDNRSQQALEKEQELTNTEAEITKKAEKSANYINNYRTEMKTLDAEIDQGYVELEKANNEVEAIIKERERLKELEKKQTYYKGSGVLAWPADASHTKISSGYGQRSIYGRTEIHRGIDIPVDYGDPVFASAAGKVVTSTTHSSYGKYIMIDHGIMEDGSSLYTLYAHNSKLLVKVDDYVEEGQQIAEAGSTGYSFGNHIHLEVRINGATVDPLGYVSPP